jgi:hypothetical protein
MLLRRKFPLNFWVKFHLFSKAFDKVPHQRLIHKLNYYGIRDKNLNWIIDFLGMVT